MQTKEQAHAAAAERRKPKAGWYEIEVSLARDNEPTEVFVGGCPEGDFLIKRGERVVVPPTVLHRLDCAVVGVDEPTFDERGNAVGNRTIDRRRFPYTVHRAL